MQDKNPKFKKPPKKYAPPGLKFLYEDRDILVVEKNQGLLVVATDRLKDKTVYVLLNNYVKKGNIKSKNRVFIVHRLDRDTSGVLIFAKTEKVKRFLQENWESFDKTYLAIVNGTLKEKEGMITSYLTENNVYRVYSTKDLEIGKYSKTGYKVVHEVEKYSQLEIKLFTGRKHQIRVHLSEMGHPVVGDKMYGESNKGIKRLGLHATSLTISHPHTKKKMTFQTGMPPYFKSLLKVDI